MAAPKNIRLTADFDEWFPQGLFLVGEITPVMEYQSQEDRARNRPVRPRIDEATGFINANRAEAARIAVETIRSTPTSVELVRLVAFGLVVFLVEMVRERVLALLCRRVVVVKRWLRIVAYHFRGIGGRS